MLCSSAVFYCIYLSSSLSRLSLFLTLSRNKVVIYSQQSTLNLLIAMIADCFTPP